VPQRSQLILECQVPPLPFLPLLLGLFSKPHSLRKNKEVQSDKKEEWQGEKLYNIDLSEQEWWKGQSSIIRFFGEHRAIACYYNEGKSAYFS